jgi:hypothetical protein
MKRTEALSKIRHCGYIGDRSKAGLIAAQKNIGTAAMRRAYLNGERDKKNNRPYDCTVCKAKRGEK